MKTLPQVFLDGRDRPANWSAIRFKQETWQSWSWAEYFAKTMEFAAYLYSTGVRAGDRVAILADTKKEWAIADMAILSLGAITVPIYANGLPEELAHIIKDSQPVALIVDTAAQMKKWAAVQILCPPIAIRVAIDIPNGDFVFFETALKMGQQSLALADCSAHILAMIAATKLSDYATVVYTSGTSGQPKGVVLTHLQIVSEVKAVSQVFSITNEDVTLSFLPYAHVLGRVEMWLSIYAGFTLCFAQSVDRLRANLTEVSPTVLISVPRIFERIYGGIASEIDKNIWLRSFFGFIGRSYPTTANTLKGLLLGKKLKAAFGGRLRFAVSGGAPFEPEIGAFFKAAGVPIYEGYGLTETTGAISVNTPDFHRFGTVGKPLPDVEIKIAEDGEILIKSDKVMACYYHSDGQSPLQNGYFPSGDMGAIDADGFLKITDRKKDLIKTSVGKYVAPQKLENALKRNPMISNALIHGEHRKYITALISLNKSEVQSWAKVRKIPFSSFAELTKTPEILKEITSQVTLVNTELASHETIKRFAILDRDFSIEKGELTPSLKLKRKFCDEKFCDVLNTLY
jgi:long-chain acyl-CoA synthetase